MSRGVVIIVAIAAGREAGKYVMTGGQFVWESMRGTMGDENLYVAMIDDPAWIHDFCRCYTDMFKTCYGKLFPPASPTACASARTWATATGRSPTPRCSAS